MRRLIAPITLMLVPALGIGAGIAHAGNWDKLSGQSSEIKQPLNAVARTQADWETLWKRHSGGDLKSIPGSLKEGEIVVAVFLGERKTGGVKVKLEPVQDPLDPAKIVVFYSEISPSNDSMAADVVSYPFAMIKLPRPYKAVDFALNARCKALQGAIRPEAGAKMRAVADHAWDFAQAPRFD